MNLQKTVYLARDMIYHMYMGCKSEQDAIDYIARWSGTGYIEKYELEGDYYYFKNAEIVGSSKELGPLMGPDLVGNRVHIAGAKSI